MKEALQELVQSAEYRRFEFEDDDFADRLMDDDEFDLMQRITKTAGPVLLLLRLGDSNETTLSKLKDTVDYISTLMVDSEQERRQHLRFCPSDGLLITDAYRIPHVADPHIQK